MKFSIIIPVYNVEKYLKPCIESVLKQSFSDFEIIMIDDGSKDSSGKICDIYAQKDKRCHVIHQKNSGLSAARNAGVSKACGEYLFFLDSDDYYINKNILKKIAKSTDKSDIIAFNGVAIYDKEFSKSKRIFKETSSTKRREDGILYLERMLNTMPLYPWYVCLYAIRKKYWTTQNFYFKEGVKYEDLELTYRILLSAQSVEYLPIVGYGYRKNRPGSIVSTYDLSSAFDRLNHVKKNIKDVLAREEVSNRLKKLLCNNFSSNYYSIMAQCVNLQRNERKILINKLVECKWICKYTISGIEQRICRLMVSWFGVLLSCQIIWSVKKILGLFSRIGQHNISLS